MGHNSHVRHKKFGGDLFAQRAERNGSENLERQRLTWAKL